MKIKMFDPDARAARRIWHEWYAWRPVFVDGHLVWLETIERQWICFATDGIVGYWGWKYRPLTASNSSLSD